MPYSTNAMLPPGVRNHLPHHAQQIFREAFNHAWREYAGDPGREERAFRVAWEAVRKRYAKVNGKWQPRERPWIPGQRLGTP